MILQAIIYRKLGLNRLNSLSHFSNEDNRGKILSEVQILYVCYYRKYNVT
ncbi:hypothetical protein J2S02_003397 [Metabacillus niabensis]|uniref:Uncharacterized protein n=1 Tax=Metabacillus niabensis TaxID=324854 RepID=A0ABT9Z471_9BACI|nr:hypothetical protein [Metabacillus niabensis]